MTNQMTEAMAGFLEVLEVIARSNARAGLSAGKKLPPSRKESDSDDQLQLGMLAAQALAMIQENNTKSLAKIGMRIAQMARSPETSNERTAAIRFAEVLKALAESGSGGKDGGGKTRSKPKRKPGKSNVRNKGTAGRTSAE